MPAVSICLVMSLDRTWLALPNVRRRRESSSRRTAVLGGNNTVARTVAAPCPLGGALVPLRIPRDLDCAARFRRRGNDAFGVAVAARHGAARPRPDCPGGGIWTDRDRLLLVDAQSTSRWKASR